MQNIFLQDSTKLVIELREYFLPYLHVALQKQQLEFARANELNLSIGPPRRGASVLILYYDFIKCFVGANMYIVFLSLHSIISVL